MPGASRPPRGARPPHPPSAAARRSRGLQAAAACAAALLVLAAPPARAGRTCAEARPSPAAIARGMELAQRTAAALDAGGVRVAVLARAGQDLQRYGLRWSHVGLAWKTDDGAWRVTHELNRCGTAGSGVWRQGLGDFFLDDLWRFEAAWIAPPPAAQQRLLALLRSPERSAALHAPRYSMVAYAWGTDYQQSNQWALETLALALAAAPEDVRSRAQAQAWLRGQGYAPTVLRLGPLQRLGGRMTRANIAFDDHPPQDRFADRIATVTADSIFDWMAARGLGGPPSRLALP
jgi:hypothetical protein